MYLKSIEINGFKSFARKTTLSFLAPQKGRQSVTAVVGPNGSGKSNVADAIRWVLGEQSMKNLRGKKSQDVIFSGSEAKGKMSAASVTLTIDNADSALPVEYEELVITRRIYSTGESEYLLNGSKVRLLDLQLLLAKAQFGQGSYSVVGQGMIDRMLLQTPEQRKDFFDEAFGIKEFQIKRRQAFLKLEKSKEHIDQAEAVLAEVTPRLKSLSRQVKKLEERKEIEIALREAEERYYVTLWHRHNLELEDLQFGLDKVKSAHKDRQNKLEAIQMELAKLAKESSRQDEYSELQSSQQNIFRQKNNLESDRAALQGRMKVEYSKAGKQNVGWLENKIALLSEDKESLSKEVESIDRSLEKVRKEIDEKKKQIDKLHIDRGELKSQIATLESQFTDAKSEQNFFHLTGLRAVQAILEEQHRFGRVYGAVAQLAKVDTKFQLAMDVAAGSHISSLVVEDEEVASDCISYLRNNQLGVATFLPLTKIRPRFMPNDIDFFVSRKGVYGLAVDLATFDSRFKNIFSYVFGATLIVENIEIAREIGIGRVRMVTLDGDVLETSGSMKGGYRRKKSSGLSFSHSQAPHMVGGHIGNYEERIEIARRELSQNEDELEAVQNSARDLESRANIQANKQELLDKQKQDLDREIASLSQELSLQTMSKEEYSSAMKYISIEKDELDRKINDLQKDLKEVEDKLENFHKEEERKKQRIFSLQDEMQAEQMEINIYSNQINEKQVAVARLETKQEDLIQEAYQELHSSIEAIAKRQTIEPIPFEQLEELQTNIQKLKYKITLIGGIDEEVISEYRETRDKHEGLISQVEDLNKAVNDLEKLIEELDSLMKKRRVKSFKAISKEFHRYFAILFEGGKADLVEIYGAENQDGEGESVEADEESVLEDNETKNRRKKKILSGIEVTASPPGKKISNLQALSGGERSLTSIALICAILHTNPPPFVVLDEVEAALDEANTLRFTRILNELSTQSQFIIITHNRATMHAADSLYGVTMGNDGISHLLSVKLDGGKVDESQDPS